MNTSISTQLCSDRYCVNGNPAGKLTGPLSSEELQSAETVMVRQIQRTPFAQEVSTLEKGHGVRTDSHLQLLTPQLDGDGVLRVGGRLTNAPLPEESRHPAILPRDSRVTALVIMSSH